MKHFVGIDLGTTNSVICTFDGRETRVWKSPEMNDVTPSVIYIDRRGNRFYGRRAYDMAPLNEKNAASLFKRYLGTNMRFTLQGIEMTPEECSAEILKALFGYLPPEIANDPETATVITVPAAFNQMKKDATLDAARMAGIRRVTLMQEPVAAVMSVMKAAPGEKTFLIYDLGGGTFDVSVAESVGSRVNLLAQGGREMCGGRDWDRMIFQQTAFPWLREHFHLPENWMTDPAWRPLSRLTMYACEQAKIELSSMEKTEIRMDEYRMNMRDLDGTEIYLDIPLSRDTMDRIIDETVQDTVDVTRQTLAKIGLSEKDVDQIVFVGGPTKYTPLRERIMSELHLRGEIPVDQMTAVAEGASIFAESIDWADAQHHRKQTREEVKATQEITLRYEKRTSADSAKVAFVVSGPVDCAAEVTSTQTGWSSGRIRLEKSTMLTLPLSIAGENVFRVEVWDGAGHQVRLPEECISIIRTMAVIGTIPATSPIAVKVLDRIGGKAVPLYLVEENDSLPKRGQVTFVSGQTLYAGSEDALVFTLWEGDIKDPIEDNRYIGTYRISGKSLPEGTVPVGAEIICDYEMSDAGALRLGVSIPSIGVNLHEANFYSRQDGQTALDDHPRLLRQIGSLEQRLALIAGRLPDSAELRSMQKKVAAIRDMAEHTDDPESLLQANNDLLECLRALSRMSRAHRHEIRMLDLDQVKEKFEHFKSIASTQEIAAFNVAMEAAKRSVDRDTGAFEANMEELQTRANFLLWRQDSVVEFNLMRRLAQPDNYMDRARFDQLRVAGLTAQKTRNYQQMRQVLAELLSIEKPNAVDAAEQMMEQVNVVRK
ncbi:MAG: Hsp70 family protein [Clostridia bacterium]|nr:Hsp70 family protein [Clostridia bacterium]